MLTVQDWVKAAEATEVNKDWFIFRKKQLSEIFPWEFIDSGIEKELLWAEYQEALAGD